MNARFAIRLPRFATLALALPLALAAPLAGAPPARATAEGAGLSTERLERLSRAMKEAVAARRIAGAVTLVARGGRVVQEESFGMADVESKTAMRTDTIFRIASMTKAVTSVAVMMLVEEGRLALQDPVSRYIAAFEKTSVAVPAPAGAVADSPVSAVPAKRAITIRDLLTHTAGIGYGYGPAAAQWKQAGIQGWYFADRAEPVAAVVERMAALPMDAQPGEKYVYGYNTDILGVVVETVSGLSLDAFFQQRILAPLKMADTHFFLPPEKRGRLAAVYSAKEDGTLERAPDARTGQGAYVDGPRQCFSGGAGLLSTARDYARLLQMLENGGSLDGVRLLSPKTVELMTANHTGTLYEEGRAGFGLGFAVTERLGRTASYSSEGAYRWGGAYFTTYWVDPQERLVAVMMAQLLPARGDNLQETFRSLVYQSIVGPAPSMR
ncbi:MAG: serine hydrolase domain-containing protein [Vicinamibacteria bacterium]